MINTLTIALSAMLAVTATSSVGQEPADSDAKAAKAEEEQVCKRLPPPVGSRVRGRRVCKTQAQWDAEQAAAEAMARETQQRGSLRNVPDS